jgi:hypothetical protein
LVTDWVPLLWLVGALVVLWLIQRQVHSHIEGLVLVLTASSEAAALAHFLLLLPGVVVHELSHWLAARLLGVRVSPISIGPERKRGREVRFGSVQIARADPLRESLIGLAPLVTGTALVLVIARWGFGLLPTLSGAVASWPARLWACLRVPDAWLWVYLVFAVSNAMLPSASDRRPWRTLAVYLALVLLVAYLLLGLPRGSEAWLAWGVRFLSYLAYAFSLTALLDVGVLVPLLLIEWLAGQLTGRRVQYGHRGE